jgi:Phosphoesterase family
MQRGSISVLTAKELENLDGLSKIARENAPPRLSDERFAALGQNNLPGLFPANANDPSGPIQHVIYIIKENRTYDQVLGDMPQGNGDPSLTLFPENVSPNHHKLAREFALLDNFYVSADVSADGHNWSMAGIAPDYVQRMWQNSYAGRRKHYDYEGGEPAALPPAGFIWNNVMSAGLSLRNYGYFVTNKPAAEATEASQVAQVRDQALIRSTHMGYRGFDLDYLDINRAKVFLNDLVKMEGENRFPRFTILRLGNDHTSGAGAGKLSALSQMADNDAAFGMIVDGLSHSKFWPKMAIFVLEDDAQNGPDHVDSHRSPAYVISPFTKRGMVDSTFYNTTSMLRTMELLLGLKPMTMFDAGSNVMSNLFTLAPDLKAYDAEKPRYRLDERNPAEGALAARTARMNFTEADEIDDDEMNAILWRAIKKTDPPAPVRSYFGRD